MMKHVIYVCLLAFSPIIAQAQSVYAPYNPDYYYLLDRYEIARKKITEGAQGTFKPYTREAIIRLTDSLQTQPDALSKADLFNIAYLVNDSWEHTDSTQQAENNSKKTFPILKNLYKKPADMYYVKEKDFGLHLRPVLYLGYGRDSRLQESSNLPTFINSRGIEIRGHIANKVGFYTLLQENQIRMPLYAQTYTNERNAVPGEGFWKRADNQVADFFHVRGYITFNLVKNYITLQAGQDKNFIGNGYRSLILSDFSAPYPFLKINTKVWRLEYTNLFAMMIANNTEVRGRYPRKYMAFHRLGVNIKDNLNIGIYESVMLSRGDSAGNNSFDAAYLNPIIFYRAAEHWLGDPDNILLGVDFKWNIANRCRLYGNLVLDEFLVKEVFSNKGWWGNKHAGQLGANYINVLGVKNLDLQAEVNYVRPYTYTHYASGGADAQSSNYQHYQQPLAHPNGANFFEYIGIVRYQPLPRFMLTAKAIYTKTGKDVSPTDNWGSNIFLDYTTRPYTNEYGNTIGQGTTVNTIFTDFTVSYQIKQGIFIDFKQIIRKAESAEASFNNTSNITQLSLRWNIAPRTYEF